VNHNLFEEKIASITGEGLFSDGIEILQVNLGLKCNQACSHCHVDASPLRKEEMRWPTMERVLETAGTVHPSVIDLTGGAPELNPFFRKFVTALRARGHFVQVRSNLTVATEPGMEDLPEFFLKHGVGLVASLPCYLEENVRAQRGPGVYEKSIAVLQRLNRIGYGIDDDKPLNLVYNPGGAFLPPEQGKLEADYRRELQQRFGISFTHLLTIANMPIGRLGGKLRQAHEEQKYFSLLRESFNPGTLSGLMCRHQISIAWDGRVYDCDFNLALGYPVNHGAPDRIEDFDKTVLEKRRIVTGNHCFGCTAGSGSSCAGALV